MQKMHIGEKTLVCEDIKVHENVGKTLDNEKYIGDVIQNNGSNTANIKERCDMGYGIANEILAILEDIPLGPYKVSGVLKLREARLLNGELCNSEILYNLKYNKIQKLSDIQINIY